MAFEPLSCHKATVLSVIVRLPTGDDEFSPPDQSGIAIGSALVTLGRFLIAFVQRSCIACNAEHCISHGNSVCPSVTRWYPTQMKIGSRILHHEVAKTL